MQTENTGNNSGTLALFSLFKLPQPPYDLWQKCVSLSSL